MLKILVSIILFYMCINVAHAEGLFKPYIVNSADSDVCNLSLKHYSDLYNSKASVTGGIGSSENVLAPKFTSHYIENVRGELKIAEVDFYGASKIFVYHGRSHSWRGDIYTGYLIEPSQMEVLENQLKVENKESFDAFYPMGSLAYGSDFSWWENLPFRYKNNWYVLADFGDFHRHNSLRDVYRIMEDGDSKRVCTIKISQDFDDAKIGETLPFFTSYKRSIEEIMLAPGGCGTSNPGGQAKLNGQIFASMAITRPWVVESTWKDRKNGSIPQNGGFQRKHFEDWKFQDVWSYREHSAYQNLMNDAIDELQKYYIANFSYSESDALEYASEVIRAIPSRYYSLGVYYDQDKDFSAFQRMVDGTYKNWVGLHQDLKLKHGSVPLVALSLMIDNPKQYGNLPPEIQMDLIKSFYNKDILMYAAHMNNYDTVRYLIDSGWPVDSVTSYDKVSLCGGKLERTNRSALTYAAENASIHLIKMLVDAGADTNIKDSKGNNLDFYINLNPRFSEEEKKAGFHGVLKMYAKKNRIAPSFSCNQNLNRIEKAICSSEGLSIFDSELSRSYSLAREGGNLLPDLKKSQIKWIKRRNSDCGNISDTDKLNSCIARSTRARIRYFEYVQSVFDEAIN